MYYVYLLQSYKDKKYYVGQTENVENRLKQHNAGSVKSTKTRLPFRLVGFEAYETRREARWREYSLKRSAQQRKLFIQSFSKNIRG